MRVEYRIRSPSLLKNLKFSENSGFIIVVFIIDGCDQTSPETGAVLL